MYFTYNHIFFAIFGKNKLTTGNVGAILFDVSDPSPNFVGRHVQLKDLHELIQRSANHSVTGMQPIVNIDNVTAITGLGGIGKTQLARRYIQVYREEYNNHIIWLNAETEVTLKHSFQRLAGHLNISTKNPDNLDKETRDIVQDVYAHFSTAGCLFKTKKW